MEEELKDNKVQESDMKDEEVSEVEDFLSPQNSLSDQDDEFAEDEMEGSNEPPPSAVSAAAGNGGSNVPPPSAVSAAVGTESQQEEDAEPEREEDEEEGSNVPPPSAVSAAVDKEESKDTEPKEDGNHQPSLSASLEKIDDLKGEMADLMVKSLDPDKYKGEKGGEAYEPFDKLEDLVKKKAGKERRKGKKQDSAGQEGGSQTEAGPGGSGTKGADQAKDNTPQGVKKKVDTLRGGQLYMAVVLARQLERGGQNPMADNKFKRFFKSSSFDSVTDKIALGGTINATAGLMNADYKSNPIAQAVTLATSLVGLVKTIKSIVEKIKKYKSLQGKTEKFMGVIGLISDFASAISKGAAIVQSIASLSGKLTDKFKSVLGYITVFANGASQIGGFITGAHGLSGARGKLNKMKALENKRWEDIEKTVLPKYSEPEAGGAEEEEDEEDSGESASTPSTAQTAQEATGQGEEKKRLSLKEKREQAKQLKQMRKERQSQANMLLRRADVSEEHKDKLVAYIASCRMVGQIKSGIRMGISGLVATALGLGTSIATGVSFTGDTSAAKAGTHLGIVSSFMGGGLSLAKMGVAKSNENRKNNEETDMIKGRLWGHINTLTDDKYGLRGLSESLEVDPSPERAEEAKGVVSKYEAVDGQLRGSFVDYGAVLKANSAEEFRKLLVAQL